MRRYLLIGNFWSVISVCWGTDLGELEPLLVVHGQVEGVGVPYVALHRRRPVQQGTITITIVDEI